MPNQYTFRAPTGVAVHVCDDFPVWEVMLTRSQDGTPIVDITTTGEGEHDEVGDAYARVFIDLDEVYEYTSPAADQWRQGDRV